MPLLFLEMVFANFMRKYAPPLTSTDTFIAARKQHPAIESAINALEIHGLDRCPDHGIDGFKCYVAWSIVGRNLIKIGAILQQNERETLKRKKQRARRLVV